MKYFSRVLGVTLLEIMLVLAIAAMVIVMSIRYYGAASTSQQTNGIIGQIQAITAAAENLSIGTGTFSAAGTTNITSIVGAVNMRTPWGSAITTSGSGTTLSITISSTPAAVCTALQARLNLMERYSGSTCSLVKYNAGATTS